MSNAAEPRTTPVAIDLIGATELQIEWGDGRRSRFPADTLRAECPCATCRQEKTGQGDVAITIGSPLPVLPQRARGGVTLDEVDPVGYYALKVTFSDGHATGIYSFEYLRGLDAAGGR